MTTFDTGNPLGSPDPRDLFDNAQNTDAAVNGEDKTWVDRFGRTRVSMKGVEEAVPDAIAARDVATSAADAAVLARDASVAAAGPMYLTEAAGRAAVADGETFKVQGSGDVAATLYRRTNAAASVFLAAFPSKAAYDGLDSLVVNSGKAFPLKPLMRGGSTSAMHADFAAAILDLKIANAQENMLYKIEHFMNGTASGSSFNKDGWSILAYDKNEFSNAAAGSGEKIIDVADAQQLIDRNSISKIVLTSKKYPELSIEIVIDGRKLPAYGSKFLRSSLSTDPGFSWVIDPVCNLSIDRGVVHKSEAPRDYLYSRGKYYPFVNSTFKGISSNPHEVFLGLIKDFRVENAEFGYFYALSYYTNGSNAWGEEKRERWIVRKRLASTYELETATETDIVGIDTEQVVLPKTGKIESITLKSNGSEKFHVVVDTSKLPAYGTWITSSLASTNGYSWYMNQSNYSYRLPGDQRSGIKSTQSYFKYSSASKSFVHRYISGSFVYQVKFGINGVNKLPNFISISRGLGADILNTAVLPVNEFTTDWLPPLVFYAENNVDSGDLRTSFTGGNHASNGDSTGDPTAENELFCIFVDDQQIDMAADFESTSKSVSVKLSHKLMASNTKIQKRFTLRQMFDLKFNGSAFDVQWALLHKSISGQAPPNPSRGYATAAV